MTSALKTRTDGAAGGAKDAQSSPRRGRIREVDGYRAIAAVMIIVFHAWSVGYEPYRDTPFVSFMLGSQFAVSLFFALSGFVIFLPVVRGGLTGQIPSGRRFLYRRFYRLLPLYFLLVIVVWAGRFNGTPLDFWDLLRHLTFTQVYSKQQIFWLIGPAWSLADEMHYYLVVALLGPPLAMLAARRRTTRGRLAMMSALPLLLLAVCLTYTSIAAYGMGIPWSDSWVYFNPIARVDCFAEGMLLAVILSIPGAMDRRPRAAAVITGAGIAGLAVLMVMRAHIPGIPVFYFPAAGIGSLLLLAGAAMMDERQRASRFLRSRPFQAMATVGFSIYLVHEPLMIQLARWHVFYFLDPVAWPVSTVGLIVSATLLAKVTYTLVERPGQRLQTLLADLRARQSRAPAPRRGPAPRWLPDVTLHTDRGDPVALRTLPRDRPVLFALDHDGGRGLAEQRFRLDAGEAEAFYVVSGDDTAAPRGTTILVDREHRLSSSLNGAPGLIEVSPAGLITDVVPAGAAVAS